MTDMIERAAREIAKTNIPAYADEKIWAEDLPMYRRRLARRDIGGVDNPIATSRAALLAALDPEDEALVASIAQRLADKATVARNEMRLVRQGIDLSNANPVSPAIFIMDVRLMLETLKRMAQGE